MSTAEKKAAAKARNGKGAAAPATTAMTRGSYHHAAAAPFPIGRGHGAAAATAPSAGFGTAAPTSSQAGFGAAAFSILWIHSRNYFRRENNSHPPGGFMGILNSQANLHFVGAPSHYAPFKAPRCADVGGSSPSDVEILLNKQHVVVDEEDENVRTEKRILWTPDEEERLMSAWIENSTDSAKGADRKGKAYWGDVSKAYNKETPPQRKRNAKQVRIDGTRLIGGVTSLNLIMRVAAMRCLRRMLFPEVI